MKHKIIAFILCVTGLSLSASAQRSHVNFDNNWKFAFGHAANPDKDFNYSIKTIFSKSGGAAGTAIDLRFNDSSWRSLNLPHDWAVELPGTVNISLLQKPIRAVVFNCSLMEFSVMRRFGSMDFILEIIKAVMLG